MKDEILPMVEEGKSFLEIYESNKTYVASNKRKIEDLIEAEKDLKKKKEEKEDRVIILETLPNIWNIDLPVEWGTKKRHYWIWSDEPNRGKTKFTDFLKKTGFAQEINTDSKYHVIDPKRNVLILDEYNNAKLTVRELNKICDGTRIYDVKNKNSVTIEKPRFTNKPTLNRGNDC